MMLTRRDLLPLLAVPWIANTGLIKEAFGGAEEPKKSETSSEGRPLTDPADVVRRAVAADKVDWSRISTWEGRQIQQIELFVQGRPITIGETEEDRYGPEESFRTTVKDRKTLARFQVDHPRFFLRLAIGESQLIIGGVGAGGNTGSLLIKTSQDTLSVLLTVAGFSLESKTADIRRLFFSYIWAHLVDEIHHRETGKHLPARFTKRLSGEDEIETQRKSYEQGR